LFELGEEGSGIFSQCMAGELHSREPGAGVMKNVALEAAFGKPCLRWMLAKRSCFTQVVASLKDTRDRIASVKNTQKITEAMKLVSAAKVRRAQDAVINGRPFAENLVKVKATDLSPCEVCTYHTPSQDL